MIPDAVAAGAVAVWGGLCAADQRSLGGRQIHQPIVAAAAAGLILGAPDRGLLVGLWMQLVWAVPLPLGGRLLPDTGSAAVAATVVAAAVAGPAGLFAALLFGLLVARVTIPWERALREANDRREMSVLSAPGGGLGRTVLLGAAGPFLRGLLLTLSAVPFAVVAAHYLNPSGVQRVGVFDGLQQGLIGGAACLGLAALLLHFRSHSGASGLRWIAGGALLGAAGRLLGLLGPP